MRQYATATDVAAYPGGSNVPTEGIDARIRTASRVVDVLLLGVVYETDTEGYPTDTGVAQALEDATCAIVVESWATGATEPGATAQWENVKIGNVALAGRKAADGTVAVAGVVVPPAALVALADVGKVTVVMA